MVAAGFTGGEAEELRRALGFKKPDGAMVKIEKKLRGGLEKNGIRGETAETIIRHITSFALYGFPESHAASFALLAYASAYLKAHFPAEFYTALLNNQPMGFYHPATLVKDAQHRGQRVKPVDVQKSDWRCRVEEDQSIRLGLVYVKGLREETGQCIEMERRRQLFSSVNDLQRRVRPNRSEITTLARIGALNSFGLKRREALWQVEKACRFSGPLFEKASSPYDTSPLQEMTAMERLASDYEGAGITIGPHAMALKRKELDSVGIVPSVSLKRIRDGQRVRVAGTVIVRQRPMTAKGFLFMSLEDETGISNIVFRPKMFKKNRLVLMSHPFLIIEGMLQNQNNVISVLAHKVRGLKGLDIPISSHDFH